MIKRFILTALLMCTVPLSPGMAQDTSAAKQINQQYAKITSTLSMDSINELLYNMAKNPASEDDLLLNMLLATPLNKRQYVFPQLHENIGMPKKILTHPEIAVWKGKMPTDIPPRLRNYAAQYLAYLPASYYVILDPDQWVELDDKNKNALTMPFKYPQFNNTAHRGEFYTFPDVKSLYRLSDKTRANYKKTDLTAQDVNRLFETTKALQKYYDDQKDPTELQHSLISLMIRNNKIEKDLGDPFASLVARLKIIKGEKEINSFFQKQGWKDADDFATKADRIIKAHRVVTLNPTVAVQLQKVRAYPEYAPTTEMIENLRMFARMYQAPPGDVYFIEPFHAEIRKNLKPDYILYLGTPIYME